MLNDQSTLHPRSIAVSCWVCAMTITITSQIVCAYLAGILSTITLGTCAFAIRQGVWAALIIVIPLGMIHALLFMGVFR